MQSYSSKLCDDNNLSLLCDFWLNISNRDSWSICLEKSLPLFMGRKENQLKMNWMKAVFSEYFSPANCQDSNGMLKPFIQFSETVLFLGNNKLWCVGWTVFTRSGPNENWTKCAHRKHIFMHNVESCDNILKKFHCESERNKQAKAKKETA